MLQNPLSVMDAISEAVEICIKCRPWRDSAWGT